MWVLEYWGHSILKNTSDYEWMEVDIQNKFDFYICHGPIQAWLSTDRLRLLSIQIVVNA